MVVQGGRYGMSLINYWVGVVKCMWSNVGAYYQVVGGCGQVVRGCDQFGCIWSV